MIIIIIIIIIIMAGMAVMKTTKLKLKRSKENKPPRIQVYPDELQDPKATAQFRARSFGKFAVLGCLEQYINNLAKTFKGDIQETTTHESARNGEAGETRWRRLCVH